MNAVAPRRLAPAPVAVRDWLASVAAHAALLAALAWGAAHVHGPHVQPAPVPIRWVDAAPEPRAADAIESAAASSMPPVVNEVPAPVAEPVAAAVAAPIATPAAAPPLATPRPPVRAASSARSRHAASERRAGAAPTRVPQPRSTASLGAPASAAEAPASPEQRSAPSTAAGADADPSPPAAPPVAARPAIAPGIAAAAEPVPAPPAHANEASRWRSDLEALLIAQKRYPRQARRMGQQGVVTIHAQFAADGELLDCEVASSSGFRTLDEAAVALVRVAAGQLRTSSVPGSRAQLRIPIAYELNGRGT